MASYRVTSQGLKAVNLARLKKKWNKHAVIWAETAGVGVATLKRFQRGICITDVNFVNICAAVGKDFQEVGEPCYSSQDINPAPNSMSGKYSYMLKIKDVDTEKLNKIKDAIREISGDDTLEIIDRWHSSIVLLIEGTLEGYERLEHLFRQGRLEDLLGVTIYSVKLKPINLWEWLQGNFAEAMSLDWQVPQTGFADANAVRRVKKVYLTDDISVRLILSIEEETEQFFRVVVVVLPDTEISNVLPLGLRLQVFNQEDEFLGEDVVEAADEPLRIEIGELEREELFRLALLLDNEEYSEEFIV